MIGVVDKHTFRDRTRVPLIKKLNPIWWFRNDTELSADGAPWYHPEWSRALDTFTGISYATRSRIFDASSLVFRIVTTR